MNQLLCNVTFLPGINTEIFESLVGPVQKLLKLDRKCALLFDEVTISPGLSYDSSRDQVIGFVDNGTVRQQRFADHAVVFMLRGIRKKWKQVVAYVFVEHSFRKENLATFITSIIRKSTEIGLHVVATVCDQGSNNEGAIKLLYQKTERKYAAKGEESRRFGFDVDNKEVVPIFDPPHLVKGIRNNLLTKDATFVKDGKKCKASWTDFVSLYNMDRDRQDMKLNMRLTEQHININKIPRMKVCFAVQVFSQRVSAIMDFAAMHGSFILQNF